MTTSTEATFQEATCRRCGEVARLTRAGWRHGWPPAGDDGHCPGTGLWPDVAPADVPSGPRTSIAVWGIRVYPSVARRGPAWTRHYYFLSPESKQVGGYTTKAETRDLVRRLWGPDAGIHWAGDR